MGKDIFQESIDRINKKYGNGSIIRGDDDNIEDVAAIPTGSIALDTAIGIGGIPQGRITEIYGPESSGKTTIATHCMVEAQKIGLPVAFVDAEHAFDFEYAENLGLDRKSMYFSQPDDGEQALDIVKELCGAGFGLIVVDSVAALTPRAELEGEIGDSKMGLHARLMSQSLRMITGPSKKNNCAIIFINQTREKIGVMFGCFNYDTLVNFTDGRSIPIGKVVDERIEGNVYCINEETGSIEEKPILDWHDNGKVKSKSDFIHIQTQSINGKGRFGATCTTDHEILTDSGWKKAKDLSYEDKLVSKYLETVNGTYEDFLNGMLVGDSTIYTRSKSTSQVKLQDNQNEDYLNWKLSKIKNFLDFKKIPVNRGHRYCSEFTYEFCKIKKELKERDPSYMLNRFSPLSLAIWYMDDGHYDDKNGHSRSLISVKRFKNNYNKLSEIVELIKKSTDIEGVDFSLSNGKIVFTKEATNQLAEIICKYVPDSMQYKLPDNFRGMYEDFQLQNTPKMVTDFVEIKKIRNASDRQMRNKRKFDISVEGNHNYMVGGSKNGFIVHNSPETTTGGNALKFYASVRMRVQRISKGSDDDGNRTQVSIKKNKVAPPFKKVEFDILFGKGISKVGEILDFGVEFEIIDKSGAWFSYDGNRLGQGRNAVLSLLEDNPELAEEIENKILSKL